MCCADRGSCATCTETSLRRPKEARGRGAALDDVNEGVRGCVFIPPKGINYQLTTHEKKNGKHKRKEKGMGEGEGEGWDVVLT